MSRLKGEYLLFGWLIGVAVVGVGSRGHSLDLDGVDVNNLAGPPESLGADLRETKVLDFSFVLEFLHLPDCLLDRSLLVHTVAVIEINVLYAESFQRLLTGLTAVLGR
jgi:hypothetical protein